MLIIVNVIRLLEALGRGLLRTLVRLYAKSKIGVRVRVGRRLTADIAIGPKFF